MCVRGERASAAVGMLAVLSAHSLNARSVGWRSAASASLLAHVPTGVPARCYAACSSQKCCVALSGKSCRCDSSVCEHSTVCAICVFLADGTECRIARCLVSNHLNSKYVSSNSSIILRRSYSSHVHVHTVRITSAQYCTVRQQ